MKTGAVIVAAGKSSRTGECKPMQQIGSISMVHRIIYTLQQAGADPVVLITGNEAEQLERHVSRTGVICLRNEQYETTDMFFSAAIGLRYLQEQCGKILITPVDVPLFTTQTVIRLMESGAPLVSPVCDGLEGHPLLIAAELLPGILDYKGEGGLRAAVASQGVSRKLVQVEDEGILYDADTPQNYRHLLLRHNRQLFRPQCRVTLAREKSFFGPGLALLLNLIDRTGSVRTACQQMQVSYSKGWNMLKGVEEELGYPVVDRRPGGAYGGTTTLTKQGRTILTRFEDYERQVKEAAQEIFERCFPEMPDH